MNHRGTYQVTTPPASEPITLSEAKAHLKVDWTDEDTLITALIVTAREMVEAHTNRALLTQTVTMAMPCFPVPRVHDSIGYFELFKSPMQELKKVEYYDEDNTLQTFYDLDAANTDNLIVNSIFEPARVQLNKDKTWPSTFARVDAIKITFVAGWTQASLVPSTIKQAMLLLIGEMYERREDFVKKMPTAVEYMLSAQTVRLW